MSKPIRSFEYYDSLDFAGLAPSKLQIEVFSPQESSELVALIRESMEELDQKEKLFSTIYRRLDKFAEEYSKEGTCLYVVRAPRSKKLIACVGLGSFQGLPWTERIGEIRDLVVQRRFRLQGLGQELLKAALKKAKTLGYKRLYLEVSQNMQAAHKIFFQNGFHPVEHLPKEGGARDKKSASYFMLADLSSLTATMEDS